MKEIFGQDRVHSEYILERSYCTLEGTLLHHIAHRLWLKQQVTYIIPEPGPPPPLPEVLRTLFTQQKLDSVMSLILAFILLQGAYIHTYKTTILNVNLPSTSLVQKCV